MAYGLILLVLFAFIARISFNTIMDSDSLASCKTKLETSGLDTQDKLKLAEICIQLRSSDSAERSATWGVLFTAFAAFAAAAAALFTWRQASAAKSQLLLARDQLTLQFPPTVLVKNIGLWPEGAIRNTRLELTPELQLEGELWMVNLGREIVSIESEVVFMPYWTTEPLPMVPPYIYDQTGDYRRIVVFKKHPDFLVPAHTMHPGEIARATFKTVVPHDYNEHMKFYVIGIIVYTDRLGIRRPVLFARFYDPKVRRFIAVSNNPDYEGTQ